MSASQLLRPCFVLVALFFGLHASAQSNNLFIYGTVKDYNTSVTLDSATVTLFKDAAQHSMVSTHANGKYELELGYGYEYTLLFEKPGMVGKSVEINTVGIPIEEQNAGLAMNIEMTLFKHIPGIDYSILQQPIGRSSYDPETKMLAWDLDYTEQLRAELNRLQKEYDEKK